MSAAVCSGSGEIFDRSGQVDALCETRRPGEEGSHRDSGEEDRWNAYCTYLHDGNETWSYVEGAEARIHYQGRLTEEMVEARGYNPTGEYAWFTVSCHHPLGTGDGGRFDYTITDPVPIDVLLDRVKERIEIGDPVIDTNPSFTERFTVVRIPTWLWADPAYWYAEHREDETAGFVTVEVRAEPVDLLWDFTGEGEEVDCPSGPGSPWTPGAEDPECSVTFTRSSAGQAGDAFDGSATVVWEFSWSLNGADQGPFDDVLALTTDFQIQVGEIQSVGRG